MQISYGSLHLLLLWLKRMGSYSNDNLQNCNTITTYTVTLNFYKGVTGLNHLKSSVQSLSCVQIFATPWTAALQTSLSITNSWSLLKLMSIESVIPSNHLILCHPLLLPPSIFPSMRIFSNESLLYIWWPKFGVSASAPLLPINIQD